MNTLITIIGGANIDMSATLNDAFIAADSNPGHIDIGYGGVARNIAHNLALLNARVQLLTIFGGDLFGGLLHDYCIQQEIDVHLSEKKSQLRSGVYLCINNHSGEMIAAVADTDAMRAVTPEWLSKRSGEINQSDYIVADTNIGEDAIRYLLENSTAPLFIDGVSSTKAHRVVNALKKSKLPYLHTLKLNLKEALAVTDTTSYVEAAQSLLNIGVEHVYITLGSDGVYCRNANDEWTFPALPPGEIINTTGAGDAFLAGVVYAHTKGIAFPQTAQYGLMAARAALMSNKAVNPNIANILL
ncbi:MAG: carbohydrate kinase family protein [Paludibacteraceae bacterium]|nr:carbohydrate kinase family protein [Paludibacteraceae bacterium]